MIWGVNHFHTHTYVFSIYWAELMNSWTKPLSTELHLRHVAWAPLDDSGKVRWPLTKTQKDRIPQENRQSWARRDLFCPVGQVFSYHHPLWFRDLSQSSLTRHHWLAHFLHLSHHGLFHIPPHFPQHTLVFLTFFLFLHLSPGNPQVTLTPLLSFSSSGDSSHTSFALAHNESLLLILFFGYCNLCDEKDMFSLKMGALLKIPAFSVHWCVRTHGQTSGSTTCMEI